MGYMKENWDSFSLFKIPIEKISNEKDSAEKFDNIIIREYH